MFGGSSTIVLEMLSVWMNISPACEVNMWDSTLAPDRFDIGISNMTDRSFNRKLVKHEECRLEIEIVLECGYLKKLKTEKLQR